MKMAGSDVAHEAMQIVNAQFAHYHEIMAGAPFPSSYNPKARFVWGEILAEKIPADKRDHEYKKRCDLYGLEWSSKPPHSNDTIRRYLTRNRIELVKEIALFYDQVEHTRIKDIRHILTVHDDHSFVIRGEIDFYKIPLKVSALKHLLLKTMAYHAYYRKATATDVQKVMLKNRLVRTLVRLLNEQRVTFMYEIVVKQPVWLPKEVPRTEEGIATFIEKKLWYPIARAHRVTDIKLRSYI